MPFSAQRLEIERRVQMLHDGSLEKDMLDEQARNALNVSHADETDDHAPARTVELTEIQLIVKKSQ